jgi:hypothetical protein
LISLELFKGIDTIGRLYNVFKPKGEKGALDQLALRREIIDDQYLHIPF